MSSLSVSQRSVGAIVGGFLADAAGVPVHWIYDQPKLDGILAQQANPEFLAQSHCPFYAIPTGSNSCYGDQEYALLQSLEECKGFNKEDYKKRLGTVFGPGTPYDFDLGRPLEKSDYPIKAAYRNGSIRGFLQNVKEGKEKTGVDDDMADGFAKVAPLVALYAGDPKLPQLVEEVVRVTQENDLAVVCSVAAAKILEQYILNGPDNAIEIARGKCQGDAADYVKAAIDKKDANHKVVVKEFGASCACPGSFKNSVHCLVSSKGDFAAINRVTLGAQGDNCCRLAYVGSCIGATVGLAGLPQDWLSKTSRSAEVVQLAEKLVALRK